MCLGSRFGASGEESELPIRSSLRLIIGEDWGIDFRSFLAPKMIEEELWQSKKRKTGLNHLVHYNLYDEQFSNGDSRYAFF